MRRWTIAAAALVLGVAAAPASAAPGAAGGARVHAVNGSPAETPPSSVWTVGRVQAGLRTEWLSGAGHGGLLGPVAETQGVLAETDDSSRPVGVDTATGALRWTDPQVDQLIGAGGGRVFVNRELSDGDGDAEVLALDAATGATDWTVTRPGLYGTYQDGRLLLSAAVSAADGTPVLLDVDPATGRVLWTQTGYLYSAAGGGRVYGVQYGAPDAGFAALTGLDPATGDVLWRAAVPSEALSLYPLSSGRIMVEQFSDAPANDDMFDGGTGRFLWGRPRIGTNPPEFTAGAVDGGDVLYQTTVSESGGPSRLYAVDETTGNAVRVSGDGADLNGAPAVGPGFLLVTCSAPGQPIQAEFVCAFGTDGRPLSVSYIGPDQGAASFITIAGGRAYLSADDKVAAISPAPLAPLPGRIEAESTTSPVLRAPADDTGGGQLVGYFPAGGTVLDYPVDVPSAGAYTVTFRVASDGASLSPPIDPQLQLQVLGVGTVATVDVPQTGGWQTWQSVSATVTLPAGPQALRIYVPAGKHAFNLNWFDVEHAAGAAARTARALPHTTATQRRSACLAGLTPSARLSRAAIAADCAGA